MRLNRTDVVATVFVAAAAVLYALWLADVGVPGLRSARVMGAVILGLGWAASASAVVPSFDALIKRGSRVYLAVTSVLGALALAAGILVLVDADEGMLATLAAATGVLWLMATVRHTMARRTGPAPPSGTRTNAIPEQRVPAMR